MHSVSDRIDFVATEHHARYIAVLLGDTVDITTHVQSEVRHIECRLGAQKRHRLRAGLATAKNSRRRIAIEDIGEIGAASKHAAGHAEWKLVVTSGNWGVRGEQTLAADSCDVVEIDARA